jgi:hypothetical protein
MKIELTQTTDDLVAFYQFDRWYSDDRKRYRLKTKLTSGAIMTVPFWLIVFDVDNEKMDSAIGLIVFGFLLFFVGFFGAKHAFLNSMRGLAIRIANDKDNSEFVGPKTLEFTADKIKWESKWGQGQCEIETIKKIKKDSEYYYLYNTSLSAYIIPRKTLKTESELNEFEQILEGYRKNWSR